MAWLNGSVALSFKIIRNNTIELRPNYRKILIEVECAYRNFVTSHAVLPVGRKLLIRLGIEEHPSDLMRLIRKFDFLVLVT